MTTDSDAAIFDGHIKTIIDTVVDGFIIIDKVGSIQCFNLAAARIFGYSTQEVTHQNVNMLMPEPYRSGHDGYLLHFLNTGEKKIIGEGREIIAQRKDGTTFPMELSVNELTLNNSQYFLGTIRDITERKNTEKELTSSLTYSETILDTVLDGIITIDKRGTIRRFNNAAERIFGYTLEDVEGKNIKMLMPDPYHSEHDGYLQHYHDTGDKKVIGLGREVAAKRKNGSVFPIELGVTEMQTEDETVFVGSIRDISERKAAEEQIKDYLAKLKRSNEELDQFAYIASHDLKEPLRGLSNNAMFLQEDFEEILGQSGEKRLTRMRLLCQRMEELVDSLLYYSRLGRQELAVESTDLSNIIQKVMELTVPEDATDVKIRMDSSKTTQFTCDVPRTTELFRNLISNAIKYNNNPQKIIDIGVTTKVEPRTGVLNEQVFYVKDNGIGIDKTFHEEVFRIFKRINEEDDSVRGTGVGLTFVKKIIERQGGSIWLDSALGSGSCFYFTITKGQLDE